MNRRRPWKTAGAVALALALIGALVTITYDDDDSEIQWSEGISLNEARQLLGFEDASLEFDDDTFEIKVSKASRSQTAALRKESDCAWSVLHDGVAIPVQGFGDVTPRAGLEVEYEVVTSTWFVDIVGSAQARGMSSLNAQIAVSGMSAASGVAVAAAASATAVAVNTYATMVQGLNAAVQAGTLTAQAATAAATGSRVFNVLVWAGEAFKFLGALAAVSNVLIPAQAILLVATVTDWSTSTYDMVRLLAYMNSTDALLERCGRSRLFNASIRAGTATGGGSAVGTFRFAGRTYSAGFHPTNIGEDDEYLRLNTTARTGSAIEALINRASSQLDALFPAHLVSSPNAARIIKQA